MKFLFVRSMSWGIALRGGQYLNKSAAPHQKENGRYLQTLDGTQVTAMTSTKRFRKCLMGILHTQAQTGKAVCFTSQEAASQFIDNMLRTNGQACFQIHQSRNTWAVTQVVVSV